MFDISGKSALITGGTSGIGAAIANRFSAAGCKVIAAGLPDEKPSSTLNHEIPVAPLDVSDPASIDRLADIASPEPHGYEWPEADPVDGLPTRGFGPQRECLFSPRLHIRWAGHSRPSASWKSTTR